MTEVLQFDVVYPLQKAYKLKLSGIVYNSAPIPVYYQYLPDGLDPENYIIYGSITDNDQSTMNSKESLVSVQVKIHTQADKYNDGKAVAKIGNEVIKNIYPLNGPVIDLSGDNLQIFSTKKISDFTENWTVNNQRVYIDRTIIFQHNISYL